MNYFEFASTILLGEELSDKLLQAPVEWTPWQEFKDVPLPGRSEKIKFSKEKMKFPKAPSLHLRENTAKAVHSFANHELLAIEMMAAAILKYPHHTDEDIRFKKGILTALKDEQKHLKLYIERINELGFEFGDFPLNDYFWRQMEKLKTPSQYAALMALTFEAANLDFAQYYSKIFRSFGDTRTADILDLVLEDEITHVSFGAHWLKKWRDDKPLWDYYVSVLPFPVTPARSKGFGFDPDLHRKAIGDEKFMESLVQYDDDFLITKRT